MDSSIVAEAVKAALEEGRLIAEEESVPFDENEMAEIARKTAQEQVDLSHIPDLEDKVSDHFPEERIMMVEDSFKFMTYKLDITDVSESSPGTALFTRFGNPILQPILLSTSAAISDTEFLEYSSILVECVYMLISAAGNVFSVSDKNIEEVAEKAKQAILKSPEAKEALDELYDVWITPDTSSFKKAKAIFNLIKAVKKAGVLRKIAWNLIKFSEKSSWIALIVRVTAYVTAAIATNGIAIVALIAKAIVRGTITVIHFLGKFEKLKELKKKEKIFSIDSYVGN